MTARRRGADLFEAARLYYVEGARQSEIAERLHVSRSNVSRMLRDAREQGVIRFQLRYPAERDALWERRLLRAHRANGLRTAVVVAEPVPPVRIDPLDVVSTAAAEWLLDNLADGQRVSIAWGTSVRAAVEHVCARRGYSVDVGQLGGDIDVLPTRSSHDVVRSLAAKLGGTYSYPDVPAVVGTAAEARALSASAAYQLDRACAADVAIIGVGAFDRGSNRILLDRAGVGRAERDRARALGVVGEICGRFYDRAGRDVELPVDERIISARTEALVSIPNTVIVAAGAHKAAAVAGALRGRMITTLVCDRPLARAVAALSA
ncbi:sugar-binding transcriptional regulator [Allokutzneria albata]|uniref:DNA-binding transcriptional regulator LsrR, DeoR family n=1 Tax=Allokutzneria albata TaxID=211114 RepID=A0A1G9S3V1_ALLAB|nr:sugar-binding domain-containing protein [Allokutzneria albata]SDM30092.1 DNA-binding transcriptional regulator LsrR, DeoR family [Allokutzneria albata]